MKKFLLASLFIFSGYVVHAAVANNYVNTSNPIDIEPTEATLVGTTASSTASGDTVQIYFEYGRSSSSLASSTTPITLSEGESVSSNDLKKFTTTISNLTPNTSVYARIVRKVTPTSGAEQFYRGQIVSFKTPILNFPPYVQSLTSKNSNFVTSNCSVTACTIEIPENLPNYTTILDMKKADPNGDTVYFSILSGNTDGAFELNNLGNFTVAKKSALDFETNPKFELVIELKDGGAGRLTSRYNLTINLKNIQNESVPLPVSYTVNDNTSVESYRYTPNTDDLVYRSGNRASGDSYSYTSNRSNTTYTSGNSTDIGTYTYNPTTGANKYIINTNSLGQQTYTYNQGNNNNYIAGSNVNIPPYNPNNPSNTNYVNGRNANISETQRQQIIQNLLAQLAVLQAELDRRIRLGIE